VSTVKARSLNRRILKVNVTRMTLAAGKSEIMADEGTALLKSTLAAELPGYITPPPGLI
jgi:hypothetical protein